MILSNFGRRLIKNQRDHGVRLVLKSGYDAPVQFIVMTFWTVIEIPSTLTVSPFPRQV